MARARADKYSSAVAERPRDASCLSVFNSTMPQAQSSLIGCFGFRSTNHSLTGTLDRPRVVAPS